MKPKSIAKTLGLLTLALCLTACGSVTQPKEITNVGTYKDYTLELQEAQIDEENNTITIKAVYTNSGDEPNYAMSSFAVRAFQNNKELPDVSNINGDQASLIQEVKSSQPVTVSYVFTLTDRSEVEVLIGEPTADQTTIGKKVYSLEE